MKNKKTLREYWKAANAGIPPEILKMAFNAEQLKELRMGFQKGMNIKVYADPKVSANKMSTARMLQEMGVEVKPELLQIYDDEQLEEIRLGEKAGIDTKIYQNPNFDASDMRTLRLLSIAQKIVESIKQKYAEIFENIKTSLEPVFGVPEQIEAATQNELEKVVFQNLQNVDVDQFDTLDQIRDAILEKVDMNDIEQAVTDQLNKTAESQETVTPEYVCLDTATVSNESFGLIQTSGKEDYFIVTDFTSQNGKMSWKDEVHFDSKEAAAEHYQNTLVSKLLNKKVEIKEIKELSEADQKLQAKIDELSEDMKVSDVKRVENFISLKKGISMEEKLYAYQHANQITYQPYFKGEPIPETLEGRYAQTYLENSSIIHSMKETGVYSCINLDEYGKKMVAEKGIVLTEDGYYHFNKEKANVQNQTTKTEKEHFGKQSMPINLKADTMSQLEKSFSDTLRNYVELNIDRDVTVNLNVAGKAIVQNAHLTTQQFKDLSFREALKQSSAFRELLTDQNLDYEKLEQEVEAIQAEVSTIPIA